jgi:ADP-L-glycero-D-manno-heptose 6-epimerase
MKIVVTGGLGFIGRELIKKLKSRGYEVFSIDFEDEDPFTEIIKQKPDFLFHLGANSSTRSKISEIYHQNYKYTEILFRICSSNNIPVAFASSGAIYGSDIRESRLPNPLTPYGYTKYFAEKLIDFQYTDIVALRYHNVYGSTEWNKKEMASIVYKWISGQEQILFNGSEEIKRDFIYIEDIIKINFMFLDYWVKFGKFNRNIFDVGTGEAVSFAELGAEIDKHTKRGIKYIDNPYDNRNYQFYTQADIEPINNIHKLLYNTDFEPIKIKEGILKTYNDYIYEF